MSEIIQGTLIFSIGLLVWAATGNLIWLGIRAIFLTIFGKRCATCGEASLESECGKCRKVRLRNADKKATPTVEDDLDGARRLLQYARSQRWVTPAAVEYLTEVIRRLAARVHGEAVGDITLPLDLPATANTAHDAAAAKLSTPAVAADEMSQLPIVAAVVAQPEPQSVPALPAIPVAQPIHPLDQPEPIRVPRAPSPVPRRIAADILRSFMERSNIRWIEIVSATLVVVCSVGLVISLWSTLSRTSRFFPSLVFMVATLAVHGAGQYTLRRWKLKTTSRGVLHIGLMLIPLSVMVGILLASRGGELVLDIGFMIAVAIGAVGYGFLAVTAARALFPHRWLGVTSAVMTTAAALVPAHVLSLRQGPSDWAAWLLLPSAAVIAATLFTMNRRNAQRIGWLPAYARRHAAEAVQLLFATLTVLIFDALQFRKVGELSVWYWSLAGWFALCWAGWGTAVAFGSLKPTGLLSNSIAHSRRPQWISIVGWSIGMLGALCTLAALFRVSYVAEARLAFLLVAGLWLTVQGLLCRASSQSVFGLSALWCAAALGGEWLTSSSPGIEWRDWIGRDRIVWFSLIGCCVPVGAWCFRLFNANKIAADKSLLIRRSRLGVDELVRRAITAAGGSGIVMNAIATMIAAAACLSLNVEAAADADWAAVCLLLNCLVPAGAALTAEAKLRSSESGAASILDKMMCLLLPVAQVFGTIAVVRLSQTGDWVPSWFESLRPGRSWAVGLALQSLVWAAAAVVLRTQKFSTVADRSGMLNRLHAVDSLLIGAIATAAVSTAWVWQIQDQFAIASYLGWYPILIGIAAWVVWSSSTARELSALALCAWTATCLQQVAASQGWWPARPIVVFDSVAALSSHVMLLSAVLIAAVLVPRIGWIRSNVHLQTRGPRWSVALLTFAAMFGLLTAVIRPAGEDLASGLGLIDLLSGDATRTVERLPNGWMLVLAWAALVCLIETSRRAVPRLAFLKYAWFVVAFVAGLLPAVLVSAEHSVALVVCASAAWMIACELIPMLQRNKAESADESRHSAMLSLNSVPFAIMSVNALLLGLLSTTAVIQAWLGQIPHDVLAIDDVAKWAQISLASRSLAVLILFGPIIAISVLRWAMCTMSSMRDTRFAAAAGVTASIFVGCAASLIAAPESMIALNRAWIGFCAASIFAVVAGTVGTIVRRQAAQEESSIDAGSAFLADWARALLSLVSIAAALLVILYPTTYVAVPDTTSVCASGFAVLTVLAGLWWFHRLRNGNLFGFAAFALASSASVVSIAYAVWLDAVPGRHFPDSADFEPFRLQIILWIASLAMGLALRVTSGKQAASKLAETTWVVLASVTGIVALLSVMCDPNRWFTFGELASTSLVIVLSSIAAGRPWRGHAAAPLAAAACLSLTIGRHAIGHGPIHVLDSFWGMLWGPALIGTVALLGQLWRQRAERNLQANDSAFSTILPSVDQAVSMHVPMTIIALSGIWVGTASFFESQLNLWSITPLALFSLALTISRLWDARSRSRAPALYVSIIAVMLTLAAVVGQTYGLAFAHRALLWLALLLISGAVMAGIVREWMRESGRLLPALGLQSLSGRLAEASRVQAWMVNLHTAVGLLLLVPIGMLEFALEERSLRLMTSALPLAAALSIMPIAVDLRRSLPRIVSLLLMTCAAVLLSWSEIEIVDGGSIDTAMQFMLRTFLALTAVAWVYTLLIAPFAGNLDWARLLRRAASVCFVVTSICGAALVGWDLADESRSFFASLPIQLKVLAVSGYLVLVLRPLFIVVVPSLFDRGVASAIRSTAVILVEVSLTVFSAAVYACFPELFSGVFQAWWPLIVFAAAFSGAALGYWSEKRGDACVADPLLRSSLLMPVVPLIGVWMVRAEGHLVWSDWHLYSVLLLCGAAVYALHGTLRPNPMFRVVSGLLTLLSFWSILHSQPSLRFYEHPQFWVLPPALAVLGFIEVNRRHYSKNMLTAARYTAVLIAYAGSTADMMLQAFAGQLWQPLILLALSVIGILAGISLRVRAFLICGSVFLFISLLGMVWHAQQAIDQVWPWWAFGILTGVSLIVMLGYFEKNRPRVLAKLEQLKSWEP